MTNNSDWSKCKKIKIKRIILNNNKCSRYYYNDIFCFPAHIKIIAGNKKKQPSEFIRNSKIKNDYNREEN